jgi:Zn-dependent protease
MGWQDRPYSYREQPSGWQKALQWLGGGSVTLGRVWGITVRVHASLLIIMAGSLLFAGLPGGLGIGNALTSSLVLFGIVLLHEFGHSLAARRVGGHADDILLWPLGGLAFVDVPRRPGPTFIVAFAGPLVNIVICCITGAALLALSGGRFALPWNPLIAFGGSLRDVVSIELIYSNSLAYYLWWIHVTSFSLFFFNMLPIYPLDGGRIAQSLLWPKMGYYNSMELSCRIGMGAAIAMGIWGLLTAQFFLVLIAFFGYTTCYSTKMTLRESANSAYEAERFSDGGSFDLRLPKRPKYQPKPMRGARPFPTQVPRDDRKTWRDFNPLEIIARRRRRKQFERLMKDE